MTRMLQIVATILLLAVSGPTTSIGQTIPALEEDERVPPVVAKSDVVLEGVITEITSGYRRQLGGCTPPDGSMLPLINVTLVVSHLYAGLIARDTVEATFLRGANSADAGLRRGTRLLAWGYYECTDANRLWGAYALYNEGTGRYTYQLYGESGSPPSAASFSSARMLALERSGAFATQQAAYKDIATVALLRIVGIAHPSAARMSIACVPAGDLLGTSKRVPTTIECAMDLRCVAGIAVGDTLAVPITFPDLEGATKFTSLCLRSLRLRRGHIQYYGAVAANVRQLFTRSERGNGFVPKSGPED